MDLLWTNQLQSNIEASLQGNYLLISKSDGKLKAIPS